MNTPHQDGLPALPIADMTYERRPAGCEPERVPAFTADQMRDYALLALRSAAPSAQPVQQAGELTDEQIEAIARSHGTGGWQTLSDMTHFGRAILAAARADVQPVVPADCDVRKIMIDVVPGWDGEGEEVYAKSNADVEKLLTSIGEKLEEYASQPIEKQAVPLTDEQVHTLYLELSQKIATLDSPAEMFADIVRDVERAHGITPPANEGKKA